MEKYDTEGGVEEDVDKESKKMRKIRKDATKGKEWTEEKKTKG